VIFSANIGKYSIHGAYGNDLHLSFVGWFWELFFIATGKATSGAP
jgi:hypothetical protein